MYKRKPVYARSVILAMIGYFLWCLSNAWATSPSFVKTVYTDIASSVAVRDLNGDGKPDIATVSWGDGVVRIRYGNGDGTFGPINSYATPVGGGPYTLLVADVNHDGKDDIIVPNFQNGYFAILLNTGAGFAASSDFVGGYIYKMAVGDFDHDGNLDLAFAAGDVKIMLGNGNGTFKPAVSYFPGPSQSSADSSATSVAVGDFNGDGILDLAVANVNQHTVSLLFGNGNGTFHLPATAVAVPGHQPIHVVVGDFDRDGLLDLTVANRGDNSGGTSVSILLGDGSGHFALASDIPIVGQPAELGVADFNGDGFLDIVVAKIEGDGSTPMLLGGGDGTFSLVSVPNAGWGGAVAVGDVNRDGRPDFVMAYNDAIVFLNSTPSLAPFANAGPDQCVAEGTLVHLDGSRSSPPPGPDVHYDWTQVAGPPVMLNLTDPVRPTFIAPSVPPGGQTLTFQLVVTAFGSASTSPPVNICIVNVNHAPVAVASAPPVVGEGTLVQLDGSASFDPDGDPLSYAWTQLSGPLVSLSDPTSPQPVFTAPLVTVSTSLTFQLVVNDQQVNSAPSPPVTVWVEPVNHAPVADTTGSTQTVNEGVTVGLNGSRSADPDGDQLYYLWTQLAGPPVTLSDPTSATPTFTAPQVTGTTSVAFQLVVSDGQLPSAPAPATVTVLDSNQPVACGAARPAVETLWPPNHRMASVTVLGVTDPDNDHVTITVTGVTQDEPVQGLGDGDSSPDAVLQGETVLLRAERAGNGNGRVYRVSFTADDGHGSSCTGAVTVCVPHDRQPSTCGDNGQLYDATQP